MRERPSILSGEHGARTEGLLAERQRELLIPGADLLTNVAPVEQLSDLAPQILGNFVFQFDREIRDTPGCIEHVRFRERVRRTRVETPPTRSAVVRLEWRVSRELEIHEQ